MKPRPIHRWKSFWLGVLVVCFLAWAWRDSMSSNSYVAWRWMTMVNAGGGGQISYATDLPGLASPEWGRFSMVSKFPDLTVQAFVGPLLVRGDGMDPFEMAEREAPASCHEAVKGSLSSLSEEDWLVFIPHWLVTLVFVGAWAGFLGWRVRRQRNLTA